jgi:hypothetical protein
MPLQNSTGPPSLKTQLISPYWKHCFFSPRGFEKASTGYCEEKGTSQTERGPVRPQRTGDEQRLRHGARPTATFLRRSGHRNSYIAITQVVAVPSDLLARNLVDHFTRNRVGRRLANRLRILYSDPPGPTATRMAAAHRASSIGAV